MGSLVVRDGRRRPRTANGRGTRDILARVAIYILTFHAPAILLVGNILVQARARHPTIRSGSGQCIRYTGDVVACARRWPGGAQQHPAASRCHESSFGLSFNS